jgi:UDP-N-acetylglucosamine--N-acetylmuramyl-(pentapeptide) pyrophosphoryl-undecaprenol N-acetylglucosamine transferase
LNGKLPFAYAPAMKILISCGGTGGHVRPGMATAEVLRQRGHEVVLWLSGKEIEKELLADWDGPTHVIPAAGFSGGLSLRSVSAVPRQVKGFLVSRTRMLHDRPDVVLAMGGYGCLGPVLGARSLGIRVVLHEANAVPGSAVSLLARFAAAVAVGMEAAAPHFRHKRVVTTGIPVSVDHGARFGAGLLKEGVPTILVVGGSQGSRVLNETAPPALALLRRDGLELQVVHLSGTQDAARVRAAYDGQGIPHSVYGFLAAMGRAYNAADLAVARAGAVTCAELCAYGVPSLLVPLPWAKRDHQAANARVLRDGGGAGIIEEHALSPARLAERLGALLSDPEVLDRMRRDAQTMAMPEAAEKLADLVEE